MPRDECMAINWRQLVYGLTHDTSSQGADSDSDSDDGNVWA